MKTNCLIKLRSYIAVLVTLAAVLTVSSALEAKELKYTYSIRSSLIYQSNPAFVSTDKKSVFTTTVTPSVNFIYGDGLTQYNLRMAASVIENSNEDVLVNYVSPDFAAGWLRSLEYGEVGVQGNYSRVAARAQSLTINGVNDIVDNITDNKSLMGYLEYDFNPMWSLFTEGNLSLVNYSENANNLADFDTRGASIKLSYHNSDFLSLYGKGDYENLSPDQFSTDSDMHSLVAGALYTPSDQVSVDFSLGGFNTSGANSESGLQIAVLGKYVSERYTLTSDIFRRAIGSGNGIYQINEHVDFKVGYKFNELTGLKAGYVRNETEATLLGPEVLAQRLFFGVEREYKNVKASFNVSYNGLEAGALSENQMVVGFTILYNPFFEDEASSDSAPLFF